MTRTEWTAAELSALLRWYEAMGVDLAMEESATDRFAVPAFAEEAPSPPPKEPAPSWQGREPPPVDAAAPRIAALGDRPAPNLAAAPPEETERLARAAASSAATLEELREALAAFEGCNLRHTAKNLVFADGTPGSRLMFVGEAPGRDEDLQGLPFVGRAGQLLDRMLKAIKLDRTEVYIANVVPWRPPGNRTPTPQETAACRPFIIRQIELADPDILVCLGNSAMRELFGTVDGILKSRGRWRDYDTGRRTIRAVATLHPAYLLRQPIHKRLVWRDLLAIRAALDGRPMPPR